jgi:hypothetical protein
MVRKSKQRSTFHVVSFKLSDEDYKKVEKVLEIAKARGLKLNKVLVFAMTKYFEQEEDPKVEQRKEQSLGKSTSTFEQNLAFHEVETKKEIEKLPSFFQGNPWISILMNRK